MEDAIIKNEQECIMEKKNRSAKTVGIFKKVAASIAPKAAQVAGIKPVAGQEEFYRRVGQKAYELYINRGADHGNDQTDWFEAERLVRAEMGL
jgi:hypothetical protein